MLQWGHCYDMGLSPLPAWSNPAQVSRHWRLPSHTVWWLCSELPGSCGWTCKSQVPPAQLTVHVWWWSVVLNFLFSIMKGLLALQASDSAAKSCKKPRPLAYVPYTSLSPTASRVSVIICPLLHSALWNGFLQTGFERRKAVQSSPRGPVTHHQWRARQSHALSLCLMVWPWAAWAHFLPEEMPVLQMTLRQSLQISSLGQQTEVIGMNNQEAWCVLNSVCFLKVKAMSCVRNIANNEWRWGGFIINVLLHHHLAFWFSLPKPICGRDLTLAVIVVIPWPVTKNWSRILSSVSVTHWWCRSVVIKCYCISVNA